MLQEFPLCEYFSVGKLLSDCYLNRPHLSLYRSVEEAEGGQEYGGAGFLVSVPWETRPIAIHMYAVTNYHVAIADGASVIRLNTKDDKSGYIKSQITKIRLTDGCGGKFFQR